jgi:deoxyadenosine/deoxycytidine kinase
MPQSNLIYLCGPHGSGKTTLERELAKDNPAILVPDLESRCIKFHTEPAYRQILKISERAIENYEYLDIARRNPDRIVLANRCIYDTLAYVRVYHARGWTTRETFEHYMDITREFFREENAEPYAIVLNPGIEAVQRHLMQRWKKKEKKWGEEDLEYNRLACEAFAQLREMPNIFYIDHEIDLETRADIKEANEWIERLQRARKERPDENLFAALSVAI